MQGPTLWKEITRGLESANSLGSWKMAWTLLIGQFKWIFSYEFFQKISCSRGNRYLLGGSKQYRQTQRASQSHKLPFCLFSFTVCRWFISKHIFEIGRYYRAHLRDEYRQAAIDVAQGVTPEPVGLANQFVADTTELVGAVVPSKAPPTSSVLQVALGPEAHFLNLLYLTSRWVFY